VTDTRPSQRSQRKRRVPAAARSEEDHVFPFRAETLQQSVSTRLRRDESKPTSGERQSETNEGNDVFLVLLQCNLSQSGPMHSVIEENSHI